MRQTFKVDGLKLPREVLEDSVGREVEQTGRGRAQHEERLGVRNELKPRVM